MKALLTQRCPCCEREEVHAHHQYITKNNGSRTIYYCLECDIYFSETFATPLAGLPTPLSRVIEIHPARSEGMSLKGTARTFLVSKKSIIDWESPLGNIKPTRMLYSLLHQFIELEIEGDKLYTKVEKTSSLVSVKGGR